MPTQVIVIIGIVFLLIMILLIQIYLSTRPSMVWGLIMPIIFCLIWLYIAFDLGSAIMDITANQLGLNYMSWLGILGMLVALLVFFVCRQSVAKQTRRQDQQRKQDLFAKQQKQAAMAALSPDHDPNKYFAEQEYQRMLTAKEAALRRSNQKEKQLAAKEQAKNKA